MTTGAVSALRAMERLLHMGAPRRKFQTGEKGWTSSRQSADGRSLIIEVPDSRGGKKQITVRREPLLLVPAPTESH